MKNKFSNWSKMFLLLTVIFSTLAVVSCKDDDEVEPAKNPVASFQFAVSPDNYLQVTFTNFSQNATAYSWNFGDGETSTEANPVHIYATGGNYKVILTAKNADNASATFDQTIEIKDPNSALGLLAGESSKTWKLFREGTCMGVGPNAEAARSWWSLDNTGIRPCIYYHTFTFNTDGSFVFDDKGSFWGEDKMFDGTPVFGTCFEAIASNMINANGADVSSLLSGTYTYTYEPTTNEVTLMGKGAWMGLAKLTTTGESADVPDSRKFKISITEHTGYDLMVISYAYEETYWDFSYVSYSNLALEPAVVEEEIPFGEDLPDVTPTALFNTFASTNPSDVQDLIPTESAVTVTAGVDDPANAAGTKVGKYQRGVEQYADLKFQLEYDCQFDNFTTVSIDVYIPSTNTYSEGGLTKNIQLWIADASQTMEFWNSWVQYDVDIADIVVDQWKTYTFNLESPTAGQGTPKTRTDLDLVGMVIGGSGHTVDGTFYIRNFKFE
ncbi:MAG: PKD domain-containing protein [Lentimicrobium sp.]|jgi:PKD repeat protein|nr:PKD domain-containing protein [Lentimicrobium sp.]